MNELEICSSPGSIFLLIGEIMAKTERQRDEKEKGKKTLLKIS